MNASTPKKLVFSLLDSPAVGGAEEYVISNLKFLAQDGYSVVLASNNPAVTKAARARFVGVPGVTVIRAPYRLDAIGNWKGLVKFFIGAPAALWWLVTTISQLKRQGQVVCLFPGFSDRLLFSPFVAWLRCPLIWLEFGPPDAVFHKNFGFPKLLYRLATPFVTKVITISQSSRAAILQTGIPNHKISIVYPGTQIFTPSAQQELLKEGRRWRQQHHLENAFLITSVGRLAHEKEFDLFLHAIHKMHQASPRHHIHAVLIGDGPSRAELEQLTQKLGLQKQVTFTGFLSNSQKMSVLSISDVFVFPSAWPLEGFGITTIEAMSVGLPVITTGAGPQKEIATNGVEGLYFTAGSPQSLAQQLQKILTNKTRRSRLSQAARVTAEQKFSDHSMHQSLQKIVQEVTI